MTDTPGERKANQAILFGYLTEHILPMLERDGTWMAPSPAPLTAAEVQVSLEAVILSDNYKRQTLMTMTEDGYLMTVKKGQITKERI